MKYRAKITNCIQLIECRYNFKKNYVCHDKYDTYIEVDTEAEAEIIEELNRVQGKSIELYSQLVELTQNE